MLKIHRCCKVCSVLLLIDYFVTLITVVDSGFVWGGRPGGEGRHFHSFLIALIIDSLRDPNTFDTVGKLVTGELEYIRRFAQADMDLDVNATLDASPTSKAMEAEGQLRGLEIEFEDLKGPPDGFVFVLPFLDLLSRLTMERVSKALREAVRNNPLVWQHLLIERPAIRNLTDEVLLTLVRRANGHLKSLSLAKSLRTSEAALEEIIDLNPEIQKLSIPGCTRIGSEAIVKLVEAHSIRARARGLPGIKQVEVRGIYNITKEHLDRLHSVLQLGGPPHQLLTPQYYGNGTDALRKLDARPIDVSVCPLCTNVRVVYDCTKHWVKYNMDDPCRGCTFCIPRCEECGCCIREISHDESLCSDLVCEDCWPGLPKCSECNKAVCSGHAQFIQGNGHGFTCEMCKWAANFESFGEI